MIYLDHLKSLLLHKWYVFLAGLKTGAPIWRLIIHDWSKFAPTELFGYAGNIGGATSKPRWARSWLHHLHCSPHHPEHWVLSWRGNPDFYQGIAEPLAKFVVILPMPETYVREMVADWMGSSKAYTKSWDIAKWLNENGPDMHLHSKTIALIEGVMEEVGYKQDGFTPWSFSATKRLMEEA